MILSLHHEALILGGGIAGSTLAIELAEAGRSCILVEKSKTAHHKVCGEFLSPEALPMLRRAGIDPGRLGAQPIHSFRIASDRSVTEAKLPATALSLTRRALDEALLERARIAGASVLRGFTVEQLLPPPHGSAESPWRAAITNAAQGSLSLCGRAAFVATGKHDLRGWQRPVRGTHGSLVALKMYFDLSLEQREELAGHVELVFYPGGYAGLQPVEEGMTNFCLLIERERFQAMQACWDRVLDYVRSHSAHLRRRLSGAAPLLAKPLAISAIPYGFRAAAAHAAPSPWRLGDQAAVMPSLCGDGMGIALRSAQRAAEFYLDGRSSADFHSDLRQRLGKRLSFATLLSKALIAAPALTYASHLWPPALSHIFEATRLPRALMHEKASAIWS